jgi:hypothetical protein
MRHLENDEARMTKDEGMTKHFKFQAFDIGIYFVIRHSDFVIAGGVS